MTAAEPSTSSPLSASFGFLSRWSRRLLQEPSLLVTGGAILVLGWLILYPLFWLFYGSFAYGDQGLGEVIEQLRALRGLQRALYDTALLIVGTLPLAFAFALPLAWITARTDTPLRALPGPRTPWSTFIRGEASFLSWVSTSAPTCSSSSRR